MAGHPLTVTTEALTTRRARHRGRGTRHRLTVLGRTVADTVTSVGGFLCDHSMAGWRVQVHLEDPADQQPLRVLGVTATALEQVVVRPASEEWPDVVLIAADLFATQDRIRRHASVAHLKSSTQVAMWGGEPDFVPSAEWLPSEYRLSYAARAFKARAVGGHVPVGRTEHLLRKRHPLEAVAP